MTGMILASASAVLSGISIVFTKAGMKRADVYRVNAQSNTIIWLMFLLAVFFEGNLSQISRIGNWPLLAASGLFLGVSWVFFYLGLEDGPVGAVLALQNLSIPLTMLFGRFFLEEPVSGLMWAGAALIGIGTVGMTGQRRPETETAGFGRWAVYEILSVVCMSVSFLFTKLDSSPVDSNVSSAARYLIVAVMMWGLYRAAGRRETGAGPAGDRMKIFLGAFFLGGGYILFYRALAVGNVNLVTTIFRMSVILSTVLSAVFLGEPMPGRKKAGLVVMAAGLALYVAGQPN